MHVCFQRLLDKVNACVRFQRLLDRVNACLCLQRLVDRVSACVAYGTGGEVGMNAQLFTQHNGNKSFTPWAAPPTPPDGT